MSSLVTDSVASTLILHYVGLHYSSVIASAIVLSVML